MSSSTSATSICCVVRSACVVRDALWRIVGDSVTHFFQGPKTMWTYFMDDEDGTLRRRIGNQVPGADVSIMFDTDAEEFEDDFYYGRNGTVRPAWY